MAKLLRLSCILVGVALCSWSTGVRCQETQGVLEVGMTLLTDAVRTGAVCLDGSPPAYHLHGGTGTGARNWILQLEGGGWCNDLLSCRARAGTRRGSTALMSKTEVFSGFLSNVPTLNPDFYNWNRVKLRYCDGGSFAGDAEYRDETGVTLNFKGQRIFDAIVDDLLPKGLAYAEKVLLSGCSAGGLATFFHCDALAERLSGTATVKCMSDAGFFLDIMDISGNYNIRSFFSSLLDLQGVQNNLNKGCVAASRENPEKCFFPQYALPFIRTPYFVLNTAYDVYQLHHSLAPQSADPQGQWNLCKQDIKYCNQAQLKTIQGLRTEMIEALKPIDGVILNGMFINSCFAHCQSELQDTWFAPSSPKLHNKTIARAVSDWYFERSTSKEVDCPYPCDSSCYNLLTTQDSVCP